MFSDDPVCKLCDGSSRRLPHWEGSFILSGGGWPSSEIKKDRENKILRQKAITARYQKISGKIPHEEIIRPEDIDLDKPVAPPPED